MYYYYNYIFIIVCYYNFSCYFYFCYSTLFCFNFIFCLICMYIIIIIIIIINIVVVVVVCDSSQHGMVSASFQLHRGVCKAPDADPLWGWTPREPAPNTNQTTGSHWLSAQQRRPMRKLDWTPSVTHRAKHSLLIFTVSERNKAASRCEAEWMRSSLHLTPRVIPYRCCGGTALITDTIQSSHPARRWTQRPSDTCRGASSSSAMSQAAIIIIITAKLSLALLPKSNTSLTIYCDPVCEIQAQVSKSNYEITSIKVWFQPLISLWFQSLTWPYSVNIKDIKVTFSQSVLYLMKGDFM